MSHALAALASLLGLPVRADSLGAAIAAPQHGVGGVVEAAARLLQQYDASPTLLCEPRHHDSVRTRLNRSIPLRMVPLLRFLSQIFLLWNYSPLDKTYHTRPPYPPHPFL